jgi:hypothetical protein
MSDQAKAHADHKQELVVEQTFPASDPANQPGSTGARAVPPQDMMPQGEAPHIPMGATLRRRFGDMGAATLAVEALVREVPIDRRQARIEPEGSAVRLEVDAAAADAARIASLLERHGALTV